MCSEGLHLMWHGDAQRRDCRVGLTDSCQSHQNASDIVMAMIDPLLEFKNEIIDVHAAVFISLMTYPE